MGKGSGRGGSHWKVSQREGGPQFSRYAELASQKANCHAVFQSSSVVSDVFKAMKNRVSDYFWPHKPSFGGFYCRI